MKQFSTRQMKVFYHSPNAVIVHFKSKHFEWCKRNLKLWGKNTTNGGKPNHNLAGCHPSILFLKI